MMHASSGMSFVCHCIPNCQRDCGLSSSVSDRYPSLCRLSHGRARSLGPNHLSAWFERPSCCTNARPFFLLKGGLVRCRQVSSSFAAVRFRFRLCSHAPTAIPVLSIPECTHSVMFFFFVYTNCINRQRRKWVARGRSSWTVAAPSRRPLQIPERIRLVPVGVQPEDQMRTPYESCQIRARTQTRKHNR